MSERTERVNAAASDALGAVMRLESGTDRITALLCATAYEISSSCGRKRWSRVIAQAALILRNMVEFYAGEERGAVKPGSRSPASTKWN
jgi:hypothetical protein